MFPPFSRWLEIMKYVPLIDGGSDYFFHEVVIIAATVKSTFGINRQLKNSFEVRLTTALPVTTLQLKKGNIRNWRPYMIIHSHAHFLPLLLKTNVLKFQVYPSSYSFTISLQKIDAFKLVKQLISTLSTTF